MMCVIPMILFSLAQATSPKRLPMIHKNDKLRVARVFVKMDESYELTVQSTFEGTHYQNVNAHFKKLFSSVNEVYISQFQLKFEVEHESALASEKEEYSFLFDKAKEDYLGLCEENEFKDNDDVKAMLAARLKKFNQWAKDHPEKSRSMVLLFTGCSYTLEKVDETKPFGLTLPASLAENLGSVVKQSFSNTGLAHTNQFCKFQNTGVVSLRRQYFKSTEKFIVTLIHEMGHLLGAGHVGLDNSNESFGIMDYDGGYYKGIIQFYNDPATIKNMTEVFDASLVVSGDRALQCWSGKNDESTCPTACVSGLGDGTCSASENCKKANCDYDGYDCNDDGTPLCAPGCRKTLIGDGLCDVQCLVDSCGPDAETERTKDCSCEDTAAIKQCLASEKGDKAKCVARCGRQIIDDLLEKAQEVLDKLRKLLPGIFAKYLGYWVAAIVVVVILIIIALFCCCCSSKKNPNRRRRQPANTKKNQASTNV
eukprot:GEMP01044446.1.p1 GENE.GEMP01044446.1~~GEMP01044446.1.p1  ORF type:complete len:511 (+),score=47.45 GEMP01044446.1:93-1535(+)